MPAAAKHPVPQGFHTISPYMIVPNAVEPTELYTKAFGAQVVTRMERPGGTTLHAEIRIGDSRILLTDENAKWGAKSPETLDGTPVSFHMYCEDADAMFDQAVAAGCTAQLPPADMFWGDHYSKVQDPFGHLWAIAPARIDGGRVAPTHGARARENESAVAIRAGGDWLLSLGTPCIGRRFPATTMNGKSSP